MTGRILNALLADNISSSFGYMLNLRFLLDTKWHCQLVIDLKIGREVQARNKNL